MRAFIDTNVLIDVLAQREGFFEASSNVLDMGATGKMELCTTSMIFATTAYLAKKVLGYKNTIKALQALSSLLALFLWTLNNVMMPYFLTCPTLRICYSIKQQNQKMRCTHYTRQKAFPCNRPPYLNTSRISYTSELST